jgi:hypothetical protein
MASVIETLDQLIGEKVIVVNNKDERFGEIGTVTRITVSNNPDTEAEIVLEFPDGALEGFFAEEIDLE